MGKQLIALAIMLTAMSLFWGVGCGSDEDTAETKLPAIIPVDTQPPTIKSSIPENGAKDVPIRVLIEDGITIVFSEPVQPGVFAVNAPDVFCVPITGWVAEWNGDSVKIIPVKGKDCFFEAITYIVEIRGVKDAAGNEMADSTITFTTTSEAE